MESQDEEMSAFKLHPAKPSAGVPGHPGTRMAPLLTPTQFHERAGQLPPDLPLSSPALRTFFRESPFPPLSSSHQVSSLCFDPLFPHPGRGMRCFPSSPAQRSRSPAVAEPLVWSAGDILWLGWLITRIPKSYQSRLDPRSDLIQKTHAAPQNLHKPARAVVIHLL